MIVTKEYQIGSTKINGKLHLFVDTPGLNDPKISNADILCEIAQLLQMTKDSVTYAGVLAESEHSTGGYNSWKSFVQQSQLKGFDWFGAIIAAIKFPLDQVTAFLTALWNLVAALKTAVLDLMPLSAMTVSLPRFTGYGVEVLIILSGGLRFIVGYGINGPYLKPWSFQATEFEAERDSEDEISDGSYMAVEPFVDLEVAEQEEISEMGEPDVRPEYLLIRTAFEHALSAQESYLPDHFAQGDHVQTESQAGNSWWWEQCVMM
ncbi:hypothetical protein N7488_004690 [Penicillium malachiteum]|nr:hypothetical protein N7488_004690 [Penicillium malachiteum]